jgi:hypothetical protein
MIDFSYDLSVVDVISVTVNDALFAFDPQSGADGDRDGTWSTISFDRDVVSPAADGNFAIATIALRAISSGEVDFAILDGSFFASDSLPGNVFGQELYPEYRVGSVTVVPIPASMWLFAGGLLGLFRMIKHRSGK